MTAEEEAGMTVLIFGGVILIGTIVVCLAAYFDQ